MMQSPCIRLSAVMMAIGICVALSGCAGQSIGLRTDFHQAGFEIQKTSKREVVAYLGLPQKILMDDDGREHFIYEGSTRLVGMCLGCGIPSAPVGIIPSLINMAGVRNGAEYVFDKGILVAKFEPTR